MATTSIREGVRRMRFSDLLERTEAKALTQEAASEFLGGSVRTFQRWAERYEAEGDDGLVDRRLGRRIAALLLQSLLRGESDVASGTVKWFNWPKGLWLHRVGWRRQGRFRPYFGRREGRPGRPAGWRQGDVRYRPQPRQGIGGKSAGEVSSPAAFCCSGASRPPGAPRVDSLFPLGGVVEVAAASKARGRP
jgi:hypothetical protein